MSFPEIGSEFFENLFSTKRSILDESKKSACVILKIIKLTIGWILQRSVRLMHREFANKGWVIFEYLFRRAIIFNNHFCTFLTSLSGTKFQSHFQFSYFSPDNFFSQTFNFRIIFCVIQVINCLHRLPALKRWYSAGEMHHSPWFIDHESFIICWHSAVQECFKNIKSQPLPLRKVVLRKIKHILELFSFLGKMILLNWTDSFI